MTRAAALLVGAVLLGGCGPKDPVVTAIPEVDPWSVPPAPGTARVPVMARDLIPGEAVAREDLAPADVPPGLVSEYAFLSPDDVVGRIAVEPVGKGEMLRRERFADPARAGLDALTPATRVRVRIPLADATDLFAPGHFVDVAAPAWGCTVLDAGEVVAVETATSYSLRPEVTHALIVTASEADRTRLAAALRGGPVAVSLRADIDVAASPVPICPR